MEVRSIEAIVKALNATVSRPFDVPWLVLDSSLAATVWNWKPQTPLLAIWNEIAEHAEKNPQWLATTLD